MEVPSYFSQYLKNIQPSRASRELAIQLHKTLRTRLSDSEDVLFGKWFSSSFLYGSYRRNTALQPIKDVDICIVLDLDTEAYTPESVVRRLNSVLKDLGYEGKTAYQRRSIRIDMSKTTLDVVPVVAVNGKDEELLIPDRTLKEWIVTHPKAHLKAATNLNTAGGKRYIPLVKIVKAWYRYQAKEKRNIKRPQPKGFTLEALVAQYQDPDAPTYAEAFTLFLENCYNTFHTSLQEGIFPSIADPGMLGETLRLSIDADEAMLFGEILEESLDWSRKALDSETYNESALYWRAVLGPKFPEASSTRKREFIEVEDTSFAENISAEEEIEEIDLLPLEEKSTFGTVKLKAEIARTENGKIEGDYISGSRALPKGMHIKFSIESITISEPYQIRWIVTNYGQEASQKEDLGHTRNTTHQQKSIWEHTAYRGTHTMTCEIIKFGFVHARSVHKVHIK